MGLARSKYVSTTELMSTGHTHDKDHAGETSEGHGRDHDEQARKEAHQPRGAAPGLQPQAVQAFGSRKRSGEEERQIEAEEAMYEPPREEFHYAHHASVHGADGANGARDTASAGAPPYIRDGGAQSPAAGRRHTSGARPWQYHLYAPDARQRGTPAVSGSLSWVSSGAVAACHFRATAGHQQGMGGVREKRRPFKPP
jgi:hypothetical protein